jgi:hypothetical protein
VPSCIGHGKNQADIPERNIALQNCNCFEPNGQYWVFTAKSESAKMRVVPPASTSAAVKELVQLSELDLQNKIIEPLLSALGFDNITDTSGPRERGKDLVATKSNEFGRVELYAIQIKLWKSSAKSASKNSFGLLLNQLAQARMELVINPNTHLKQKPDKCLFFTPYAIPNRAEEDYHERLIGILQLGVEIVDGPAIIRLMAQHIPSALETFSMNLQYRLRLSREVTRIPESRAAFEGNDLDLTQLYVEVTLIEDSVVDRLIGAVKTPIIVSLSVADVKSIETSVREFDSDGVFSRVECLTETRHDVKDGRINIDLRQELKPVIQVLSRYVEQRQGLMIPDSTGVQLTEIALNSIYIRNRLEALKKNRWIDESWAALGEVGTNQPRPMSLSLATILRISTPVLIIGGPGAGKTTAMRWLARTAAQSNDAPLPVLISLVGMKGPKVGELFGRIAEQLRDLGYANIDFKSRTALLENLLKNGKIRLLFDGLDETGSLAEPLLRVFDQLCDHYPKTPVVVSCRDTLRLQPWRRAFVVRLQAFSNEQLRGFIHNWFSVEAKAEQLIQWLWANSRMREAARTPLIAALLCSLFAVQADMPSTEVDLYDRRFELLLGRWEQAKGLPSLGPKLRRNYFKFLQTLAFFLHSRERRTATHNEVLSIAKISNRMGLACDYGEMVEDCVRRGVLERQHDGQLSLGHLTYQEFLAACWLIERKDTLFIWRHLPEPWWQKTWEFYASKTEDLTAVVNEGVARRDERSMGTLRGLLKLAPYTSKRALNRLEDAPFRVREPISEDDPLEISELE